MNIQSENIPLQPPIISRKLTLERQPFIYVLCPISNSWYFLQSHLFHTSAPTFRATRQLHKWDSQIDEWCVPLRGNSTPNCDFSRLELWTFAILLLVGSGPPIKLLADQCPPGSSSSAVHVKLGYARDSPLASISQPIGAAKAIILIAAHIDNNKMF